MKRIKIGVFGVGRGISLAKNMMLCNADIVALCDNNEERMAKAVENIGGNVATYSDFDSFIEHDLDAVILANFFNEHAPYAIKCLERGIHVFSECISNGTMAEGVALMRAAERSNAIYMLAENYPNMLFNREMKRVVETGTLGRIIYAEGEYNHPGDPFDIKFKKEYTYFKAHWRNYLPGSYYVTHSLAPIMAATGATPTRVTSFAVYNPTKDEIPAANYNSDNTAFMLTQNDDGSVFRFTGCARMGAHGNSYRVAGTKGQIENMRGMDGKVMLRYNPWQLPEGMEAVNLYMPDWNDPDEEFIKTSGHGGGDYITCRTFINCVNEGKQPPFPYDLRSAVNMSSVAILAHRSMLEGGKPYDIPDFTKEEARAEYENDYLTPFFGPSGEAPTLPCCSNPDHKPTDEQIALYEKLVLNS